MKELSKEAIRRVIFNNLNSGNIRKFSVDYECDYSTDISFVYKYNVSSDIHKYSVFAKAEKNDSGLVSREYENIKKFSNIKYESPLYRIPKIVLYDHELGVLCLEQCTGILFLDEIERSCRWVTKGIGEISASSSALGKWLTHYQNSTFKKIPNSADTFLVDEFNVYSAHLETDSTPNFIKALYMQCEAQFFSEIGRIVHPVHTAISHGDFHPGNFFIDTQCVTAIDFQHAKRRLVGYDALYFHLNLMLGFERLWYKPRMIRLIISCFFKSYSIPLMYHKILKPLIVIRALVYLNTISINNSNIKSVLLVQRDAKKLARWLDT